MRRIIYVNDDFLPEEDAKISVFDRGFLFADAVYEVFPVLRGSIIDAHAHLTRLKRSLNELQIPSCRSLPEYLSIIKILVQKNRLEEGLVYMQESRGTHERSFDFPSVSSPSLVMFTQQKNIINDPKIKTGIRVITTPDLRWQRCDIKTVALLPACLAKAKATGQGADDAWMVDRNGFITEGTSSNTYIITRENKIITRHLSSAILHGITRASILKLISRTSLDLEERPFNITEAENAQEAFYTSASGFVMPVTRINDKKLADGFPGPNTLKLRKLCVEMAIQSAVEV